MDKGLDKRPEVVGGRHVTTPRTASMIEFLGSAFGSGPVQLSSEEYRAMARLYEEEKPPPRPPRPVRVPDPPNTPQYKQRDADEAYQREVAQWEKWKPDAIRAWHQAGADRNMMRHAECDGLRLVAWLAKHVEPGKDPLKTLVQLAMDAGYDVDPADVDWVEEEPVTDGIIQSDPGV
jgi:hypothetical protein